MNGTPTRQFRLNSQIVADAEEIISARGVCRDIHTTGDIAAAGEEPEVVVRRILTSRLNHNFLVTKGHIVDEQLRVSPEFDVIIADRTSAPPLYTTSDGTQYVPYEAVFAVGEIKASYKLGELKQFCSNIRTLETTLERVRLPAGVMQFGDITVANFRAEQEGKGYKNPLFSFYLAAGNEAEITNRMLKNMSTQISPYWPYVPCTITVLTQLTVLCAKVNVAKEEGYFESWQPILTPDLAVEFAKAGHECHWIALRPTQSAESPAVNLASLLVNLAHCLNNVVLTQPKLFNYLKQAIDLDAAQFVDLAPVFSRESKKPKKK